MYIKTKDGIYEVEWNSYVEMWCDIKTHKGFILDSMFSKEDYRLDDNLAELCDAFVYVDTKHNIALYKYMIRKSLCDNDTKYMKMGTEIYGAIWTSKGLIYVAKMNSEGKLCLI